MNTPLTFFQAKRTLDCSIFHDLFLIGFPAVAGFNKSYDTFNRFVYPFHTSKRAFVQPRRNVSQPPRIRYANNLHSIFTSFCPLSDLINSPMTNTGTIFAIPKLNLLSFISDFQNINTAKTIRLLGDIKQSLINQTF